jgi:hypothetical protein
MLKPTLGWCILLLFSVSAPAISLRDFEALRHERYYFGTDKAFIGDPFDFSGVGTNGEMWATLISDFFFISATHYYPGTNSEVVFHEGNSLDGASHSYTVAGGQPIGSTDLWIGWFDTAVDASIARYPVLDLPMESDYIGLTAFNYGLGNRVGLNVLEDVQFVSPGFPNSVVFLYDYDGDDTPSVDGDETFLEGGDSGAPTFSVWSGKLALTGIHAGIDFPVFADSAVPAYIDEINTVLAGKGQQLRLVPEPSQALLLAGGLSILAVTTPRRNRRKVSRCS